METKYSKVFKAETYKEARKLCPKGYRMLEICELVRIGREEHPIIFDTEKGKCISFWSSTKTKNGVHRLYLNRNLDVDTNYGDLTVSSGDGRVFFVKVEE